MWLFVLKHLNKIYSYRDMVDLRFLIYGCLVVVVDCWPFMREISDNRTRKCLEILDYYRKFSYDTHTIIVYICNVVCYRIGIYEKISDLRENLRYCNFYNNY